MASGGKKISLKGWSVPSDAPAYLISALEDLGVREWRMDAKRKKVSNPYIEDMSLAVIGKRMDAISVPWCAYFVGAKLEQHGIPSSKSGMARSYLKWGEGVDYSDLDNLRPGDIVVNWRGRYDDGITGHVYFFLFTKGGKLYGVGGNQSDSVSVEEFSRSRVIGVRGPRGITKSRTARSAGGALVSETVKESVNQVLPDPDKVNGTLDQVRGPLEQLSTYKPWIMGVLSIVTLACIAYALYFRWSDWKEGR